MPPMGRLTLRLSDSMHRAARELARQDGVSLTEWIRDAVSERIGGARVQAELDELRERVAQLERERRS